MKYGFFGGSFNPVTKAHIGLALEICSNYNLDKVIFVPVGNHYNKKDLASEEDRFNMLKMATMQYPKLEVSDIELNLKSNLTTLEALSLIDSTYSEIEKYYIMGADNLCKILSLQDVNKLVEKYNYIIIQRGELDCRELINSNEILINNQSHFWVMDNKKYINTNATDVRINISKDKIEDIPEEVLEYIKIKQLYKT